MDDPVVQRQRRLVDIQEIDGSTPSGIILGSLFCSLIMGLNAVGGDGPLQGLGGGFDSHQVHWRLGTRLGRIDWEWRDRPLDSSSSPTPGPGSLTPVFLEGSRIRFAGPVC